MTDAGAGRRIAVAMRANLLPGIGLWAVAAAVVLAYYQMPTTRDTFAAVSGWKAEHGYLFSAVANALAGGVLPWLIAAALGRGARRADLLFLAGLCAWRAIEVDTLYRLQGWWFGDGTDAGTVAIKVAVDQLTYSALWSAPTTIAAMHWRSGGFTGAALREALTWRTIAASWWPLVAANWMVWTPTCAFVYSLPADLQIPLFCLASCFWMLVVLVILAPARGAGRD